MAQWIPQEEGVKQILQVLTAMNSSDTNVHAQIQIQVAHYRQLPDFNRYLLWIMNNYTGQGQEFVRASAGMVIKNNLLRHHDMINEDEQKYLKSEVVKTLSDSSAQVRRTCGNLITVLIFVSSLKSWPGIINYLSNCLDSSDPNLVEGALDALDKICEDHGAELDVEDIGKPVNFLLPKFLHFFNSPIQRHKMLALSCITKLMFIQPPPLVQNIDKFLEGFYFLASDPDINMRRRVVHACLTLIEHCPHHINTTTQFPKLIEFMLFCIRDSNLDLALAATDFWTVITNQEHICEVVLKPYLPQVLATLLTRMMYTKDDLQDMGGYEDGSEDSHVPDSSKNIKPTFITDHVRTKTDEDDTEEYDHIGHWNIRKGSAEGLDFIAQVFPGKVIVDNLLPLIEKGLQSPDWLTRESSILALGCVAIGTYEEMKQYLPKLVPYLYTLLKDQYPLIRSITCWTLGRYSMWIFKHQDKANYFDKLINDLLIHIKDKNKRVQKSATSALAVTIENTREKILPYTDAILHTFNEAFGFFQRANLLALYDCISTLSWALDNNLNNEKFLKLLLPPLFAMWEKTRDDDTDLFPLLECFSNIVKSLGSAFAPYTSTIYSRCLKLIEDVVLGIMRARTNSGHNPPYYEFLFCSVDLISSLIIAMKGNMDSLIQNSKLVPILVEISKDPDLNSNCFATIGLICRHCPDQIRPVALTIVPQLLSAMDPFRPYTCIDAMKTCGLLFQSLKSPQLVEQFAEQILKRLINIFMDKNMTDYRLQETCAVAMGRVATFAPRIMAPEIQIYLRPWSISIRNEQNDYEKECGLVGLCEVVRLNPVAIVPDLSSFLEVFASLHNVFDPSNAQLFGNMLHSFKGQIPQEFNAVFSKLSQTSQATLRKRFNL